MIQNNVQRVGPDLADAAVVGALNHTLGDNVPQGDAVPQGKGPALADAGRNRFIPQSGHDRPETVVRVAVIKSGLARQRRRKGTQDKHARLCVKDRLKRMHLMLRHKNRLLH